MRKFRWDLCLVLLTMADSRAVMKFCEKHFLWTKKPSCLNCDLFSLGSRYTTLRRQTFMSCQCDFSL